MAKRVSASEKLSKMMQFFHCKPDFYTLKELEKRLPKECGIPAMKLMDFLKEAIDDNLIRCEKMGTVNIYWSFPKEQYHSAVCAIERAQSGIEMYGVENAKKRKHMEKLVEQCKESKERMEMKKIHASLKEKIAAQERMQHLSDNCSREAFEHNLAQIAALKQQINKYTDNIFALQGFVSKRMGLSKKDFDRSFDISPDMDYIDE